jgi:hypothetical protein
MKTPSERELIDAAERILRQREQELDGLTSARLRAARLRAVEQARQSRFHRLAGRWTGIAVAATIAAVVWFTVPANFTIPGSDDAVLAQFDLPAEDNLELYRDLEFYGWLASQEGAS